MGRTWLPFFPPWVIVVLAGAALAAGVASYARTRGRNPAKAGLLLLLRAAGVGAMGVCLFGPARLPPAVRSEQRPIVEIWVDTSASMAVDDMDGRSRLDFAREVWLSPRMLARLSENRELRLAAFDETVSHLPPNHAAVENLRAEGSTTHIVRSLLGGLNAHPAGHETARALLLMSDGIDLKGAHPAPVIEAARARGIAIHVVPLGGARLEQNLSLYARPLQDMLIAGEQGAVMVQVFQTNVGHRRVRLQIDDGIEPRVEELEFRGEPYVTREVPVRHEEPGTYTYNFRVEPLPREVETRDNHQAIYLEVSPKRFRVLMVEGSPGWDTKFIAHALRNDPRMELLQVSQLSATRRETLVTRIEPDEAAFPETAEALAAFDAVVLGRSPDRVAGEAWLELLGDYVSERGGGLLWARGPPESIGLSPAAAAGLAPLSPVLEPGEVRLEPRLRPTAAGRLHPAFGFDSGDRLDDILDRLPPVEWGIIGRARSGAEVLAEFTDPAAPFPALLAMPHGSGRVVLFAGEGLWRWRLLEPELSAYDGLYEFLWSVLLRELVTAGAFQPGQEVSLQVSPVNVRSGETVTVAVSRRWQSVPMEGMRCLLVHPDGRREQLALGAWNQAGTRWAIELTPQAEGSYQVELEAPGAAPAQLERRFNVASVDAERLQTGARPEWLRMLARETGGEMLDPRRPDRLPDLLDLQQAALETPVAPVLIWDRAWVMLILLALLGLEWILRKSGGWM